MNYLSKNRLLDAESELILSRDKFNIFNVEFTFIEKVLQVC
jgi:hypothetical protein